MLNVRRAEIVMSKWTTAEMILHFKNPSFVNEIYFKLNERYTCNWALLKYVENKQLMDIDLLQGLTKFWNLVTMKVKF